VGFGWKCLFVRSAVNYEPNGPLSIEWLSSRISKASSDFPQQYGFAMTP
jgi:hypothetical protein